MIKIVLLICLFATVTVFAQNTKITTIQIKPTDVQKIVAEKNITRVAALANAEKLKRVKELMKGKVEPSKVTSLTLFSPLNLSVKDSTIEEKAFLIFDFPETISAYQNKAVFSPADKVQPKLKIGFKAPATGFYAFDFYLQKGPTGNSSSQTVKFVDLFSGITTRNLDAPQYQHQIFVTQVKNAGWNMVWLESDNAIWTFLGVEISQVK
jgi:hypothetical protein